jgi:MFS family permease
MSNTSPTAILLNIGHALDHLIILIFAAAVATIAAEYAMPWHDLMPYTVGAFVMFGMGSIPAGRLGDLWGRRAMMLVFFFGMAASTLLIALTRSPWQLAAALTLMGAVAAIYHPVGIPMLVRNAARPGFTIGVNGLAGNLGIAVAAALTGLLIKHSGWRAAFLVPGAISFACGVAFALTAPGESEPPAKRKPALIELPRALVMRVFAVMTASAICGSLLFNFTTNGNNQLIVERMHGVVEDPATLGLLLGLVYVCASFVQLLVGKAIDAYPIKRVYLAVALAQVPVFLLAAHAQGWVFYLLAVAFMVCVFGQIPFSDALNTRFFDDRMRSRVSGARFAISFTASALAVWLLGPVVKSSGFATLLTAMAVIAACTVLLVMLLPDDSEVAAAAAAKPVT